MYEPQVSERTDLTPPLLLVQGRGLDREDIRPLFCKTEGCNIFEAFPQRPDALGCRVQGELVLLLLPKGRGNLVDIFSRYSIRGTASSALPLG